MDDRLRPMLAAAGLRYNRARRQVAERLRAEHRPMSAQDVSRAEPSVPHSSVYRTLALLTQAGVLCRLIGADGIARFELAEAVTGEHHHHLACGICGALEILVLPASVEEGLARASRDAQQSRTFAVDSHRVELTGRCAACGPPRILPSPAPAPEPPAGGRMN